MAGAMEHQATLLFGGLGWYKAHAGPGDCLANGLRVSRIVLLPLDVGLHIGRWDQPHGVTQCLELARPVVRRGAGFDTDQTGRQLLEERQDVAALQLAANDHLALGRQRRRREPGKLTWRCRNRLSLSSAWFAPLNRGSLNSAHIHGTDVPVEEPSTASDSDITAISCSKEKAARRRLFNSTLMIVDQAAINAGFDFRRYAIKPRPAK